MLMGIFWTSLFALSTSFGGPGQYWSSSKSKMQFGIVDAFG
jgi:hypothetical protein